MCGVDRVERGGEKLALAGADRGLARAGPFGIRMQQVDLAEEEAWIVRGV